jgi:hypothetical protein
MEQAFCWAIIQSILWTLKEIEKHEIPFFHYVRYIFLARYSKPGKYDSEIAAELDRCNFSLEQRNIISGWIQRKINLVTSDGVKVRYFQYDRDRGSWQWPKINQEEIDCNIQVSGLPERLIEEETEVVIRVSLSNPVSKKQTDTIISNSSVEVDIFVDDPDVMWLVSLQQLTQLAKIFRQVLKAIRNNVPNCQRIHLFGAVPTGACIVIGQAINPRMNAPVELYQFDASASPPYKWALTLKN